MKKYLFFAFAVAGMLSSCTSDDSIVGENTVDDDSPVAIRLSIGQAVIGTRGTGTVGGFDDDSDNKWNKQDFNVYMFEKGTLNFAMDTRDSSKPIYKNALFQAPENAVSGLAHPDDDAIKYYPPQGKYDFWGYRLDDAVVEEPEIVDDKLTIQFTMNGSQDIMVAKAIPSAADTLALKNRGNNTADRAYSSYAARVRGGETVQPNLIFHHLLSRLTFKVIPGGEGAVNATTPVVVDSIKVISPKSGKLVVAAVGDISGELQTITWDDLNEETDSLALMQRSSANTNEGLAKLASVSLANRGDYETPGDPSTPFIAEEVSVGEALLVAPNQTSYKIIVFLHQPSLVELGNSTTEPIKYQYEDVIQIDGVQPFKPGYSYDVKITLWGLSDIKISTTLQKWVEGDSIPLYPEDHE